MLIVGITIAFFAVLERLPYTRFRQSVFLRSYFLSDVTYLFTGFIVGGSLVTAYIINASSWLGGFGLSRLSASNLPIWVSLPLALVALDLGNYIAHYLLHHFECLWQFHKVHHSSPTLDWLATFRSHIVEQVLRRLLAPAVLILFGFSIEVMLAAGSIFVGWAVFNHSNLKVRLQFLEGVLITPRLHRVHHLNDACVRNLGTMLTIWDQLRGTYSDIETDEHARFSNGEADYPQRWLPQLVRPFADMATITKHKS